MPLAKRQVHLTFRASQLAFLILPQKDRCHRILTPLEKSLRPKQHGVTGT